MRFSIPVVLLCASIAFAQFDDEDEGDGDEWADFDYKHAGLSQIEFQNVKEAGISKEKLLHLLEIGVRPSVYLKEPWKDLGVSESEWLSERGKGMEDADIDRTYKNQAGNQGMAYLSFLLPSYYQWSIGETSLAVAMDIAWLTCVGLTAFLWNNGDASEWVYPAVGIGLVHLWSGLDAVFSTQWDNNPEARNFSWGIVPTGKRAFVAGASLRF